MYIFIIIIEVYKMSYELLVTTHENDEYVDDDIILVCKDFDSSKIYECTIQYDVFNDIVVNFIMLCIRHDLYMVSKICDESLSVVFSKLSIEMTFDLNIVDISTTDSKRYYDELFSD